MRWQQSRKASDAKARDLRRRVEDALSRGKPAEAEAQARAVMAAYEDSVPTDEPYLTAWRYRTRALARLGQHAAVVQEYAGLIDACRPVLGDDRVLGFQISRAGQLNYLGQYSNAEAGCRMAIEQSRSIEPSRLGDGFRMLAVINLLGALNGRDMHQEAESLACSAISEATASADLPDRTRILHMLRIGLADSLNGQGRYREAEEALRDLPPESPVNSIVVQRTLAVAWLGLGRLAEAEAGAREAVAVGEQFLGPGHYQTLAAGAVLGSVLARQGKLDEAKRQLEAGATAWAEHFGDDHPKTIAARAELARLGHNSEE